jgi:glycerate 2-kinase
MPGAGAAGGLGFGLCSFAGARLSPGFHLFTHYAGLQDRLQNADLVITAEGMIDRQTLMGKGVGQIASLCEQYSVPCIAFAGALENRNDAAARFRQVAALTDVTSVDEAMARAAESLESLAAKVAAEFAL